MSKMNLTPGSKKFRLLVLIAQNGTMKYGEIQRFICEMNGLNYDEMSTETVWKKAPVGSSQRYMSNGVKKVRAHRGIWATNLSSGRDPILRNYCERVYYKNGKLQGWAVKPMVIEAINKLTQTPKSSLESTFSSDEIPNNSKVVERRVIRILDTETIKPAFWTPKASTVDTILQNLNPAREDILTASRLAATVSPLVALHEKYAALKKEHLELSAEKDRIELRMLDIMRMRHGIKQEATAFFE